MTSRSLSSSDGKLRSPQRTKSLLPHNCLMASRKWGGNFAISRSCIKAQVLHQWNTQPALVGSTHISTSTASLYYEDDKSFCSLACYRGHRWWIHNCSIAALLLTSLTGLKECRLYLDKIMNEIKHLQICCMCSEYYFFSTAQMTHWHERNAQHTYC